MAEINEELGEQAEALVGEEEDEVLEEKVVDDAEYAIEGRNALFDLVVAVAENA